MITWWSCEKLVAVTTSSQRTKEKKSYESNDEKAIGEKGWGEYKDYAQVVAWSGDSRKISAL